MESMNNKQQEFLNDLIEQSKALNEKSLSLTRCLLMALMKFNEDGIQFRELKTILNISDGKLKSNLDFLEEVNYIKKVQVQLDQKKMHIYMLTEAGKKEIKKLVEWIQIFQKVEEF